MTIVLDPSAAQAVEQVEVMLRRLRHAAERMLDVRTSAAELPAQVDWQTPSARLFHTEAENWRAQVARLAAEVDAAAEEAGRAHTRLIARMGHFGR